MDVKTNKVVVTADRTVKGEKLAQLKKQVKAAGRQGRDCKRTEGKFTTKIAGGDAIYGDGGRCSLGFNVTLDGKPAFLTAGHCTTAIASWSEYEGGAEIAESGDGKFPGDDYGARHVHRRHRAPERGQPLRRQHPGDLRRRPRPGRPEGHPQR